MVLQGGFSAAMHESVRKTSHTLGQFPSGRASAMVFIVRIKSQPFAVDAEGNLALRAPYRIFFFQGNPRHPPYGWQLTSRAFHLLSAGAFVKYFSAYCENLLDGIC